MGHVPEAFVDRVGLGPQHVLFLLCVLRVEWLSVSLCLPVGLRGLDSFSGVVIQMALGAPFFTDR